MKSTLQKLQEGMLYPFSEEKVLGLVKFKAVVNNKLNATYVKEYQFEKKVNFIGYTIFSFSHNVFKSLFSY